MPTLAHSYDPETDVLTVEGIRYAASLFRFMAHCDSVGKAFRLLGNQGTLTIASLPEYDEQPPCKHGASVVQAGDRRG